MLSRFKLYAILSIFPNGKLVLVFFILLLLDIVSWIPQQCHNGYGLFGCISHNFKYKTTKDCQEFIKVVVVINTMDMLVKLFELNVITITIHGKANILYAECHWYIHLETITVIPTATGTMSKRLSQIDYMSSSQLDQWRRDDCDYTSAWGHRTVSITVALAFGQFVTYISFCHSIFATMTANNTQVQRMIAVHSMWIKYTIAMFIEFVRFQFSLKLFRLSAPGVPD